MNTDKFTLIYTSGINSHGGREYLKYIINEYSDKKYFVFLDSRINPKEFQIKNYIQYSNNISLRISVFFKRFFWKIQNKENIEEFFLNGIPPLFKISDSNKIIIMFQNVFLLDPNFNNYLNKVNKIKFILLRKFIKFFLLDSYEVILQTYSMMSHFKKLNKKNNTIRVNRKIWKNYFDKNFTNKYNLRELRENSKNFIKIEKIINSNKTTYFYPASFDKHKNHYRLIKAFENLFRKIKHNIFILLTINNRDIIHITNEKNIITTGKINRNYLNYLFSNSNFLIFPSIIESLGIPLLEAKYSNLKIISSNIDVIAEISDPLFTFEPENIEDISSKIIKSYKLNENK